MIAPSLFLNALDSVVILGVALPVILMSRGIKVSTLRSLSMLLGSFLVIHGIYHLFEVTEIVTGYGTFGLAADLFVEPASYLLLLGFAVSFARRV